MIRSGLSAFLRTSTIRGFTQEVLGAMDPEIAHQSTLSALRLGLVPEQTESDAPELSSELAGMHMVNPVGMAAGFDKNGDVPNALGRIGFGLVEVGTLTPRPQTGNPKPRLFRLPKAGGVINRMGFNNDGHQMALERLRQTHTSACLGVNIGANKDSEDFVADYVAGVKCFADYADYLTANISSPNTPGLRTLQSEEALKRLLGEVLAERARASLRVPVFLKIAPDLDEAAMDEIVTVIEMTDLDGLIISNTTLSRAGVAGQAHADEAGGLSGKPLFNLSTQRLAQMRQRVGPDMSIIGVGGVHSAKSALAKFEAGANAVQLYSALAYEGLELLEKIKAGLLAATRAAGHNSVSHLTSSKVDAWANGKAHF